MYVYTNQGSYTKSGFTFHDNPWHFRKYIKFHDIFIDFVHAMCRDSKILYLIRHILLLKRFQQNSKMIMYFHDFSTMFATFNDFPDKFVNSLTCQVFQGFYDHQEPCKCIMYFISMYMCIIMYVLLCMCYYVCMYYHVCFFFHMCTICFTGLQTALRSLATLLGCK